MANNNSTVLVGPHPGVVASQLPPMLTARHLALTPSKTELFLSSSYSDLSAPQALVLVRRGRHGSQWKHQRYGTPTGPREWRLDSYVRILFLPPILTHFCSF